MLQRHALSERLLRVLVGSGMSGVQGTVAFLNREGRSRSMPPVDRQRVITLSSI